MALFTLIVLVVVTVLIRLGALVGLWQARTGLPIALVNIHMVLAVSLVAAMTSLVLHLKAPLGGLTFADGSTAGS